MLSAAMADFRRSLAHLAIVRGVVLERSCILIRLEHGPFGSHASQGGIAFEGYEMLKGLEGVRTQQASRVAADSSKTLRIWSN